MNLKSLICAVAVAVGVGSALHADTLTFPANTTTVHELTDHKTYDGMLFDENSKVTLTGAADGVAAACSVEGKNVFLTLTAPVPTTYYFIGSDPLNFSSFASSAAGAAHGWNSDSAATTALAHTVSELYDYVHAPKAPYAELRTRNSSADETFAGKTLTLGNGSRLTLKSAGTGDASLPAKTVTVPQLVIGDGTAIIGIGEAANAFKLAGNIAFAKSDSTLVILGSLSGDAQDWRQLEIASTATGAGVLAIGATADNVGKPGTQVLTLSGGFGDFTGTIGSLSASRLSGAFRLSVKGAFGGKVASLPLLDSAKDNLIAFDYEKLVDGAAKGLKVATPTPDETILGQVTLVLSAAKYDGKELALMTFPAGLTKAAGDFTVSYAESFGGEVKAFAGLRLRTNDDGTKTLMGTVPGGYPKLGGKTPIKEKTQNDQTVYRYYDFAYGERGNQQGEGGTAHHGTGQLFDVYTQPSPSGAKPIMISIHGGAWSDADDKDGKPGADPADAFGALESAFAAYGDFMVFNMNYILQPANSRADGVVNPDATIVNMLKDVDAMVSHLKTFLPANGVDVPAKIAVNGSSAGAQLAALYAFDGANPSVMNLGLRHEIPVGLVVDVVGPVDLSTLLPEGGSTDSPGYKFLCGLAGVPATSPREDLVAALKALDATRLVNDKTPYTIGVYTETSQGSGTDGVVSFKNYENLEAALGSRLLGHYVANAKHGTVLSKSEDQAWLVNAVVKAKTHLQADAPEPPPASGVTFVALADSLKLAVEGASDGDELRLEKGTFAVASTITSSKALKISGGWTDASTQDPEAVTTLDGGGDGSTSATANGLFRFTAGEGTISLSKLIFARGWASGLKKEGNAYLVVTDCRFLDNGYYAGTGGDGYQGLGAYVSGSSASTEVSFTRCVFSNNVTRITTPYLKMQGAGLYAQNLKSLTLEQADFLFNGMPHSFARNGTVVGRESMHGFALYAGGAPTTATGCRFIGNCGAAHRGGNSGSVVYLTGASGGSSFKNCLWAGNLGACFEGANWSGVSGALVVSLNSNDAAVSVENCTMAFNAIEGKDASAGLTVDKGAVTLRSSIIWGNYATWEDNGNDSAQCVAVHANGSLDADYSIFEASDGIYVRSSGSLTLGTNMKYTDPLFAAPSNFMTLYLGFINDYGGKMKRRFYFKETVDFGLLDLHVKSTTGRYAAGEWVVDDVLSGAIDKGDPAAGYANEPAPNGNCVNMGFYGNTAEASKSMAVESARIESCVIDQTKDYTNPHLTVTLADEGDWELPVRFCWGLSQGEEAGDGWEHAVTLSEAAGPGAVLSTDFGVYLEHGATVHYRVILGNGTGVDAKADSFVITSELPEGWGKGGGPNVIHVFAGRNGRGTCWLDAVSTLEDALKAVTAERHTIWVSGELVRAAPTAKMNVTVPVTIIGGFKDLDETEPETGSAVIDGATLYDGLVLNNSAAVTIRNLDFVRALGHGLAKTGAGDLTLRNCRFLDNGYGTELDGRGLLCSGSSATTVTMTDCVVSGNVARVATEVNGGNGAGASFTTFKSVVLNRVDFLDNGFARSFLTARPDNYNGDTPGRSASRGSALRVNGAPLAATGCRFVGNRCTGHTDWNSGGSTVSVEGASGGTTFANCLFSANATYWWSYGGFATRGGALYVNLDGKADEVSLGNCTFAHNLLFAGECGASLTVDRGAVEVKNSIFWGNRFGAASKGNEQKAGNFVSAHEIYVKADGSVSFDRSLIPSVDSPCVRVAAGGAWTPTNVLNDDPLFVTTTNEVLATQARRPDDAWRYADYFPPATDLEAFNVHLCSRTGYTDERTGELVKHRGVRSPAIDAGDPATPVGDEPSPNGGRVNLGYYGGTPYASGSATGLMLLLR